MYSPKIMEDLIPTIYKTAKNRRTKMTTLVNQILEKCLNEVSGINDTESPTDGNEHNETFSDLGIVIYFHNQQDIRRAYRNVSNLKA